jgi:hypothetical protein
MVAEFGDDPRADASALTLPKASIGINPSKPGGVDIGTASSTKSTTALDLTAAFVVCALAEALSPAKVAAFFVSAVALPLIGIPGIAALTVAVTFAGSVALVLLSKEVSGANASSEYVAKLRTSATCGWTSFGVAATKMIEAKPKTR